MNQNVKDSSSLYIIGKEFVIVVVVVFSAASFTLGYLVGKSVQKGSGLVVLKTAEHITAKQDKGRSEPGLPESNDSSADMYPSGNQRTAAFSRLGSEASNVIENSSVNNASPASKNKEMRDNILYTIQLGAFRNSDDADNFRLKYSNKGYSTYISMVNDSAGETIYKVRMGSFKTREHADLFSVKFKKNEGVSAFVAFKTE